MRIRSSDLSMLLPDQFSVLDMYVICSLSCCSMFSWKCVCTFLMKREIQQEITLFSCHSAHNVIATPINNPMLIFIDWIMAEVYDSCQQQGQFSPIMSVVQSKSPSICLGLTCIGCAQYPGDPLCVLLLNHCLLEVGIDIAQTLISFLAFGTGDVMAL